MLTFLPPDVTAPALPRKPGEWLLTIVEVGRVGSGRTEHVHAWEKFPGAPLVLVTEVPAHDPPPASPSGLTVTHRPSGMSIIQDTWRAGKPPVPPTWATAVRIYEWMMHQPIDWAANEDSVIRQVNHNEYVLKRIRDLNSRTPHEARGAVADLPELDYRPTRQMPAEVRAARREKAGARIPWEPTVVVVPVGNYTASGQTVSLFGWEISPDAPLIINQALATLKRPNRQRKQLWNITHRASKMSVFSARNPMPWAVIEAAYHWFMSLPVDWSTSNTTQIVNQVNGLAGTPGLKSHFSEVYHSFNSGVLPQERDMAAFFQALRATRGEP